MIYHLRYWWHVLLRKLRIVPFGRYAKSYKTLDEIIADYERDPEMRALLKEAREELNKARTN